MAFSVILLFSLFSCVNVKKENGTKIEDALGNVSYVNKDSRVVSCYGSFADCWFLSGGELCGVTSDALDMNLSIGGAEIVGSVKEVNLEILTSLNPDFIILSADLTAHLSLETSLKAMGFDYGYFRIDTFNDYKSLMADFCEVNERSDLFYENVLEVEERIDAVKISIPQNCDKSVLLMRAYSSGVKAKRDDNLAGVILKEFGLNNIADDYPSLLEEISLEYIVKTDPDYIFVLTMGDEEASLKYLKDNIQNNPAWSSLKAVKNGAYKVLPKELFHYKPNNKWDKSYEYLAKIVFE